MNAKENSGKVSRSWHPFRVHLKTFKMYAKSRFIKTEVGMCLTSNRHSFHDLRLQEEDVREPLRRLGAVM